MKQIIASRTLPLPEGVEVQVKARKIRVKGPRGECRTQGASLLGCNKVVQRKSETA